MYLKINKKWQLAVDILMVILGTLIMGFAFSVFLEPNNISTGGFSGLSMIVSALLGKLGITWTIPICFKNAWQKIRHKGNHRHSILFSWNGVIFNASN